MAKVKLRVFEIHNPNINKKQSDICTKLNKCLNESSAVDKRRMLLNPEDPQKEEDLISDFAKNLDATDPQFCTMLRIALGNNVQHVNSGLFSKPNFTIAELNSTAVDAEAIYKNHYYFSLTNDFLITNLPGNITITRLQTYLNWLLKDLYEISPMISEDVVKDLSELKNIVIKDPSINPTNESNDSTTKKSSFNLGSAALAFVREALIDTQKLTDIELQQMISAKLVIEFNKSKKSDSEALKKAYSALLKPVADLDNYELLTRKNKKILKGQKIVKSKEIDIETTESGHLNEAQLAQEMSRFIVELQDEKQKTSA